MLNKLRRLINDGEGLTVEFKRCESDNLSDKTLVIVHLSDNVSDNDNMSDNVSNNIYWDIILNYVHSK